MAINILKKVRSGRASDMQISSMLDFLESNDGVASGKFQSIHGKNALKLKWEELATLLNSQREPEKNATQWLTVWRDLKSRISIKARNIKIGRAATGNKHIPEAMLTAMDMRIVGLIGVNYIEGSSDCADSTPEEESVQERLEAGDDSGLFVSPKSSGIIIPIDVRTDNKDADYEFIFEDEETNEPQPEPKPETSEPTPAPTRVKRKAGQNIAQNKRVCNKGLRGTLKDARQEFLDVSKKHADAMELMANAAIKQAEAMAIFADGAQKQADAALQYAANDAERLHVLTKLTEVLDKII